MSWMTQLFPSSRPQQRDFECLSVDALQSHPLDSIDLIRIVEQTVNSRRTEADICLPVDLN